MLGHFLNKKKNKTIINQKEQVIFAITITSNIKVLAIDNINPYLKYIKNLIDGKFILSHAINFISPKDVDEERVMHPKSNNIKYMPQDNANEVVNQLFE